MTSAQRHNIRVGLRAARGMGKADRAWLYASARLGPLGIIVVALRAATEAAQANASA